MLNSEQINGLHRLYWSDRWPIRKIERHLRMGWKTIKKYLDAPAQGPSQRERGSKLDPFKAIIAEWLEKDLAVSAALIHERLQPLGFSGSHSMLRLHVRKLRSQLTPKRAYVRVAPCAGERFEADWAHFDVLKCSGDIRKLYAFALVDAHSRMLYVEFTHSQSFETFVRCHIQPFMRCMVWRGKSSTTTWHQRLRNVTGASFVSFRVSSASLLASTGGPSHEQRDLDKRTA
jgi:transposase